MNLIFLKGCCRCGTFVVGQSPTAQWPSTGRWCYLGGHLSVAGRTAAGPETPWHDLVPLLAAQATRQVSLGEGTVTSP